jgi:hypothetical protein
MARRPASKARLWVAPLLTLPALLARCSGTEADNPVTDAVVTACKSQPEYDPAQLAQYWSTHSPSAQSAAASGAEVRKSTRLPSEGAAPLTPAADYGIALACIEWQLSGSTLQVQLINFNSGCGAEWRAKATLQQDGLTIALDNTLCAVAACGNCLYDTATSVELPALQDTRLTLSLNKFCDGHPTLLEWTLPLTERASGRSCEYASPLGLGGATDEAFLRCGMNDSCNPGLDCEPFPSSYPPTRCLPRCATTEDCPVGTRCDASHCMADTTLPVSR